MLTHQERQSIYDEIGQLKGRIDQIKGQIEMIKGQVNSNWSEIRELDEARRFHEREARKPHMRDVGYQGGHTDRGISDLKMKNADLQSKKDALYQEMNGLHARKQEIYAKLKG